MGRLIRIFQNIRRERYVSLEQYFVHVSHTENVWTRYAPHAPRLNTHDYVHKLYMYILYADMRPEGAIIYSDT